MSHWLPILLAMASLFSSPSQADDVEQCVSLLEANRLQGAEQTLNAEAIRVFNWNIQKTSRKGWVEDLQRLATGSDLVLLQEAILEAELRERLVGDYHAVFAPGYVTNEYNSGVYTASRVAPNAHCTLSHDEPWLGTPKATNVSSYAVEGIAEQLLVINLHGVNFTLNSSALAKQLNDASRLVRSHKGPVIFSGDFNTWSGARMDALDAIMNNLGMTAVSFEDDARTSVFGNVLDHIFIRGLKTIDTGSSQVSSSDHNPVYATLTIVQ